jgi:large subunit ribosomal protein L9e
MKTINGTKFLDIPEGVEVTCKSRTVSVKGPRGELTRTFKHVQLEMEMTTNAAGAPQLKIQLWFGTRKQIATIRTIYSHVENMVIGVTQGYCYKMRFVYSHFPINVALNGRVVEIRNFLGDKLVRKVKLLDGVDYVRTADVKDQIELTSNDIAAVSLTAARIRQSCDIKHKDLRKFLDGIFVSQKGPIPKDD